MQDSAGSDQAQHAFVIEVGADGAMVLAPGRAFTSAHIPAMTAAANAVAEALNLFPAQAEAS